MIMRAPEKDFETAKEYFKYYSSWESFFITATLYTWMRTDVDRSEYLCPEHRAIGLSIAQRVAMRIETTQFPESIEHPLAY